MSTKRTQRRGTATIAELLHAYELRTGLVDEEVGALVGVHQSQISRWKRGTGVPRESYLPALAELLDLDVETLEASRQASEKLRREIVRKKAASPEAELRRVRDELRKARARIARLEAKLRGE